MYSRKPLSGAVGVARVLHGPVAFHLTGPGGDEWRFDPPDATPAATTVLGPAVELCEVAGQRASKAA